MELVHGTRLPEKMGKLGTELLTGMSIKIRMNVNAISRLTILPTTWPIGRDTVLQGSETVNKGKTKKRKDQIKATNLPGSAEKVAVRQLALERDRKER